MKNCNALEDQTTRRIGLIACATALAVTFALWRPQPARADNVTPPPVPADIRVPPGNKAFLKGHAVGTQNYVCLPSGAGFAWTLFTPQASLFGGDDEQVTTHFFSPNPFENGTSLATWRHSRDTSTVWARPIQHPSSDPRFVARDAIPWLLLQKVKVQDGPTGGDTLTATTFIQRLNTAGGIAPSTGCSQATHVGAKAFVPYTADYFFYSKDDSK
jgi:Protein of unknown function (DUF3455)